MGNLKNDLIDGLWNKKPHMGSFYHCYIVHSFLANGHLKDTIKTMKYVWLVNAVQPIEISVNGYLCKLFIDSKILKQEAEIWRGHATFQQVLKLTDKIEKSFKAQNNSLKLSQRLFIFVKKKQSNKEKRITYIACIRQIPDEALTNSSSSVNTLLNHVRVGKEL